MPLLGEMSDFTEFALNEFRILEFFGLRICLSPRLVRLPGLKF